MSNMHYSECAESLRAMSAIHARPADSFLCQSADAIDKLSTRVAELEAENGRIQSALRDILKAWQQPSNKTERREAFDKHWPTIQRMGLYEGDSQ